jgi:hypothetical protein
MVLFKLAFSAVSEFEDEGPNYLLTPRSSADLLCSSQLVAQSSPLPCEVGHEFAKNHQAG